MRCLPSYGNALYNECQEMLILWKKPKISQLSLRLSSPDSWNGLLTDTSLLHAASSSVTVSIERNR